MSGIDTSRMRASAWLETEIPTFPPLQADDHVDVAVIGGGVTGITTAWLLAREGRRVALIDRDRLVAGDSGHTTAHLTYVTDARLSELVSHFGEPTAQAVWDAGMDAIDTIDGIIRETEADCDFRWTAGHLHEPVPDSVGTTSSSHREIESLKRDAELAERLGFDAQYLDSVPGVGRPGIRFGGQATFHPGKYLAQVLRRLAATGAHIYENTACEAVLEGPTRVVANGHTIRCDYLVIATHTPLMGKQGPLGATLFQTKLARYTSYVLGARLPAGTMPAALYWDTGDPYEYLRIDNTAGGQFAILGGRDVKTGQEGDGNAIFARLAERLRRRLPDAVITHRWLGQVVEADDGLPFIGENAHREFIATGFGGNGYTFGTVAATMARDCYLGRPSPWTDLFRVDRRPLHGGLWRYLTENMDYPRFLLRDRLKRRGMRDVDSLAPGEGALVMHEGRKLAAWRDESGQLTLLSPICTHLKCVVHWNKAGRSWDCPCHGSRFKPTGEVLAGPAEAPLARWTGPGAPAPQAPISASKAPPYSTSTRDLDRPSRHP